MFKTFVLVTLFAVAFSVPKTYDACEKEAQAGGKKFFCKECKVADKSSNTCKKADDVNCKALKECYKNVDELNKRKAEKELQEKIKNICPTSTRGCADSNPYCPVWASSRPSQCNTNPEWMLAYCPRSCCPICNRRNTFGISKCPSDEKTRDLCVPNQPPYLNQCDSWAEDNQCKKNKRWMIQNCMTSCCVVCRTDVLGCPTTSKGCTNKHGDDDQCRGWAANGECRNNPSWMGENCARECCPSCRPYSPSGLPRGPGPVAPVAPRFGGYGFDPRFRG